jgi:hypothetical protein
MVVESHAIAALGMLIKDRNQPLMLCTALLRSFPPQPGPGVEVVGVDLDAIPGLRTYNGVVWSEQRLLVRGHVDGIQFVAEEAPRPVEVVTSIGGIGTV